MLNVLVVKGAIQLVAGLGVTKVVTQVIRNNTTIMTATDAILVRVGSLVLGSMVVKAANDHVGERFDEVIENIQKRKDEAEAKAEAEAEIEAEPDGA